MANDSKSAGPEAYVWDLTISLKEKDIPVGEIKQCLDEWAKKWIFQKELGASGYLHYQVRLSLFKKQRMGPLGNKIKHTIIAGHLSLTSNEGAKKFNYVMKADTRVEGPWKDDDPVILKELIGKKLSPWQQTASDDILVNEEKDNTRSINVIYDPFGNRGKSFFVKWMCTKHNCQRIPKMKDAQEMIQFAMSFSKKHAYLIDLARSANKSKKTMTELWSAIETIKDGYLYDIRYKGRDLWMNSVPVWVFTNELPDLKALTEDRWNIWTINYGGKLVSYSAQTIANVTKRRMDERKPIVLKRMRVDEELTEEKVEEKVEHLVASLQGGE